MHGPRRSRSIPQKLAMALSMSLLPFAAGAQDEGDRRLAAWTETEPILEELAGEIREIFYETRRRHPACSSVDGAAELARGQAEHLEDTLATGTGKVFVSVEMAPTLRLALTAIGEQNSRQSAVFLPARREIARRGGEGFEHYGFLLTSEVEAWRDQIEEYRAGQEQLEVLCGELEATLVEIFPVVVELFQLESSWGHDQQEREAALAKERDRLRARVEGLVDRMVEHARADFLRPLEPVPARRVVVLDFPPPD